MILQTFHCSFWPCWPAGFFNCSNRIYSTTASAECLKTPPIIPHRIPRLHICVSQWICSCSEFIISTTGDCRPTCRTWSRLNQKYRRFDEIVDTDCRGSLQHYMLVQQMTTVSSKITFRFMWMGNRPMRRKSSDALWEPIGDAWVFSRDTVRPHPSP